MGRSRQITFRIPLEIYEEIERIGKQRGYKNLSALFFALSIMAIQDSRRLVWIQQLANAKPKEQNELVSRMLKWPLSLQAMLEMTRKLDS